MSGVAIEGKVILITGANRGIGKALASKALELGAKRSTPLPEMNPSSLM